MRRTGLRRAGLRRTGVRRPKLRRASPNRRLHASLLCMGFALSLVAGRLIQLQGLEGASISRLAAQYRLQVISIPAERGAITTADGTPLALTVQQDTVTADPPQITGKTPAATAALRQQVAGLLAGPLHLPAATILNNLNHPTSPDYVVLAKAVPVPVGNQIEALMTAHKVAGISLAPIYVRSYPNGDLAANLVGFTNTVNGDLQGEAGIEQSLNSLLAGRDGLQRVETGTSGQSIPGTSENVRTLMPGGKIPATGRSTVGARLVTLAGW